MRLSKVPSHDLYPHVETRSRAPYPTDYTMSQPAVDPRGLGFFSPQTAFYQSSATGQSQPQASTATGMEYLANNPLINVGFSTVQRTMKDFAGKTPHALPNEMKKSIKSIRHYFAVDQNYVMKKLCLLLFPFRSRNWALSYNADEPVPPRLDTNAPDYYIPLMSAFTYVLIAGMVLGIQNRFTPEQLGMHASSVLIWNIIEVCVLSLAFYIFDVQSKLRLLDLIAYCGYKYVGMITALASYFISQSLWIYRLVLFYTSLSLCYFLIKSLRLQILSETGRTQIDESHGKKRRVHLLLLVVFIQPVFIWYLTRHLIVV